MIFWPFARQRRQEGRVLASSVGQNFNEDRITQSWMIRLSLLAAVFPARLLKIRIGNPHFLQRTNFQRLHAVSVTGFDVIVANCMQGAMNSEMGSMI